MFRITCHISLKTTCPKCTNGAAHFVAKGDDRMVTFHKCKSRYTLIASYHIWTCNQLFSDKTYQAYSPFQLYQPVGRNTICRNAVLPIAIPRLAECAKRLITCHGMVGELVSDHVTSSSRHLYFSLMCFRTSLLSARLAVQYLCPIIASYVSGCV